MLSIRINSLNKFLDLYSDAEIQVSLSNPLFSSGVSDGSYLFSFKIPNSPTNASMLGFPGRISRIGSVYKVKLPCSLFWKFRAWKTGSLVVTSASPRDIEIQIGVDESALLSENKDKTLPSFFEDDVTYLGADRFQIASFMNNLVDKIYPDTRFCWPMYYNPLAINGMRNADLASLYQSYFPYANYYAVDTFLNGVLSPGGIDLRPLYSPQIFLGSVLDKIFSGIKTNKNIFCSDQELSSLFVFTPSICNFLFTNSIWNGQTMMPYGYLHAKDFLPDVSATDFLSALLTMFSAKLIANRDGSFSLVSSQSLLESDDIISLPKGALVGIDHVDVENSVSEYNYSMKQINDGFQNEDIKSIENYNIIGHVNTFQDISSITGMKYSDICYVVERNAWFVYTYDDQSYNLGWQLLTKNFPYTFNRKQWWDGLNVFKDPDYTIDTAAGTILYEGYFGFHVDQIDPNQRVLKIPSVNIKGMVTGMYETYEDRFNDIAFLFYRGLQTPYGSQQKFPMASYDNVFGGNIIGNYSLSWDSEYGLYEKFHRPLFDFLKGSVLFKTKLNLSDSVVLNIDISKKHVCDNIQLFFKKIDFTIKGSSIKNIKAECYKI